VIDTTDLPIKYQGDPSLGSWFGDEDLKAAVVARMRYHRRLDQIVQGVYQYADSAKGIGEYKGCLVGCTLPMIAPELHTAMEDWVLDHGRAELGTRSVVAAWHVLGELHYGIPWYVFDVLDTAFEDSFSENAPYFAVKALEAISVGARYEDRAGLVDAYYERGRGGLLAWLQYEGRPGV
jgi:hypothetical protein